MGTWQRAGKTKSAEKRVKVNDLRAAKKKIAPREMEEVKCGLTVDPNNE